MKKIPTLFERDWTGDRSRVVDKLNPACQWVADGEGIATRKIDGACCMVRGGTLYKRREVRNSEENPAGFELADFDAETKKRVGWVPVGDGAEDRWFREAWDYVPTYFRGMGGIAPDWTYELIGPKVQGNPEDGRIHVLIPHSPPGSTGELRSDPPRTFAALRDWLQSEEGNIEGLVWHHLDGRMAKIKLRDFGLKRKARVTRPAPASDGRAV